MSTTSHPGGLSILRPDSSEGRRAVVLPEFDGHNLIFIVGAPRSGTTWLQRLLASHPRIVTGQETHLFAYVGPLLRSWRRALERERDPSSASGRGGVGLGCYLTEPEYLASVKLYLDSLLEVVTRNVAGGQFFLEKTPGHALYIEEIRELLPRCRFIHLLRDGRDVVASLLAASTGWGRGWAPRASSKATGIWLKHVRAARRAAAKLPREAFLEVRYETLLDDPVGTLTELARFIGLDWDPDSIREAVEMNRAEKVQRGGGTPIPLGGEYGRTAGPVVVDPGEFVRKARAGSWRTDLSPAQRLNVWRLARNTLKECGYARGLRDWF